MKKYIIKEEQIEELLNYLKNRSYLSIRTLLNQLEEFELIKVYDEVLKEIESDKWIVKTIINGGGKEIDFHKSKQELIKNIQKLKEKKDEK